MGGMAPGPASLKPPLLADMNMLKARTFKSIRFHISYIARKSGSINKIPLCMSLCIVSGKNIIISCLTEIN